MLSELGVRLRAVGRKRASVLLGLWGEAGVGKTHAARRLLRELPFPSLSASASDALALLSERAWTRAPAWAVSTLERAARDGDLATPGVAEALGAALASAAPIAVHLEDLHDVPDAVVSLVRALARSAAHAKGVALLVTARTPPPEPFEAHRVVPLDASASAALLQAELGAALPPAALEWIYERAAGNPLFTLEYVRHLARSGSLWNDGRRWHWRAPARAAVPLTIEALIERVLWTAAPDPEARRVLLAAALLSGFPAADLADDVWAGAAGIAPSALQRASLQLQRGGVLDAGAFAHPLYREVLLRAVTPQERRDAARRAVALLADRPLLAARLVDEADLPREDALLVLRRAAQASAEGGSALQEARLLARAAAHAAGEDQGRLALRAAAVLQHHDLPEAVRLAELALASPGAGLDAVQLYVESLARQGQVPDLPALLGRLPERLNAEGELPALLLRAQHLAGQHAAVLEGWAAQPQLHARASPELHKAVAGSALALGRMDLARGLLDRALSAATDALLRCELLSNRAIAFYHAGDSQAADATLRSALELLRGVDSPRMHSSLLVNRAAFLRMLGDYCGMGACLEEALRLRQHGGDGKAYAFAQAGLAELRVEQGRYDEAEDLLGEALATLELFGPSRLLINTRSVACQLYLAQADAQASPIAPLLALKHAERALLEAREAGGPRVVRELLFDASLASTRGGNPQQGLRYAAEMHDLAQAAGNAPIDRLRTLWAQARAQAGLGNVPAARLALREALAAAREQHAALEEHKVRLDLARLEGDVEAAREALRWFEERGLRHGATLARLAFPALAGPTAPASAPPAPGLHLEVLGPVRFAGIPVRGRKRRELLGALLEARVAGRTEVGRLELLDALYPTEHGSEDDVRASASLKELIHAVRDSMGAAAILTTPSGYALGAGVTSDLEAFLRSGDTRLWRGAYLEGQTSTLDAVREGAHLALRAHAERGLLSDPHEAARVGRLLLDADPYDLQALTLTVRALRAANNHKTLARVYAQARAYLQDVGESLPQRWQDFLKGRSEGERSAEAFSSGGPVAPSP